MKKSEDRELEKEKEKHGHDYTPQSKTSRKGDAKIFDLNDEDSGVRENVFQDIARNLIRQDDRFGNFEKKILYLDCNNLYGIYLYLGLCIPIIINVYSLGSVQTLPLPLKDFRWDNDFGPELETFFRGRSRDYTRDVKTKSWDSYFGVAQKSVGYYIEVDISFPDKTKKNLKDFPPTPSHTSVNFDDLSGFAQRAHTEIQGEKATYQPDSKLMLTFDDKKRYVIHSALADEYSLHGVTFTNVRNVLAFTQDNFLKSWVDLNTEGRKRASLEGNESLRSFFKVHINSHCHTN